MNILTVQEAAKFLRVSPLSLNTWRCTRKVKVPYFTVGRRVLYRQEDLEKYVEVQIKATQNHLKASSIP